MEIKYDKKADAIYVRLSDAPYAYGKDLDTERRVDYDANGKPRGIEVTCVSHGVNLDDLPEPKELERELRTKNIRVFARNRPVS
jgi:uncharacterized protein YuzE